MTTPIEWTDETWNPTVGCARDVRDRCVDAGIPFFFKQWGEHRPLLDHLHTGGGCPVPVVEIPSPDGSRHGEMARVGKAAAGRALDGRTWDEMPAQWAAGAGSRHR